MTLRATSGGAAPLIVEDADTVTQRDGTTAQSFSVANTWTSSTVKEVCQIKWASNILDIGSIPGTGGGSIRQVRVGQFNSDGTLRNGINVNPANDWTHIMTNGGIRYSFKSGVGLLISTALILQWADGSDTSLSSADSGISRNSAKVLEVNTGTAGTYAGTALVLGLQTVAQLPAAAAGIAGARATVSDSTTTIITGLGLTVAGGGANKTPVWCDGTNWKVG